MHNKNRTQTLNADDPRETLDEKRRHNQEGCESIAGDKELKTNADRRENGEITLKRRLTAVP